MNFCFDFLLISAFCFYFEWLIMWLSLFDEKKTIACQEK